MWNPEYLWSTMEETKNPMEETKNPMEAERLNCFGEIILWVKRKVFFVLAWALLTINTPAFSSEWSGKPYNNEGYYPPASFLTPPNNNVEEESCFLENWAFVSEAFECLTDEDLQKAYCLISPK